MKRAAALLLGTALLAGCAGSGNTQELAADAEYFTYPAENVTAFDVSPEGILYTAEGETDSVLCEYDLQGGRTELAGIGGKAEAIACFDGSVYYTQPADNGTEIYRFDVQGGQTEKLCGLDGFYQVRNFEITGGSAYILGADDTRFGVRGTYSDEFGTYSYNGERLMKISLDSGEISGSPVEFPQAFSVLDGNALVYAADENGYYFTDFDGGGKSYNDLSNITAMELYDKDKIMFCSDNLIFKLCSGSVNQEDGIAEMLENKIVLNGNDIRFEGGFGFIYNRYGQFGSGMNIGMIERFRAADYIKENNKIRFISAEYSFDDPFGCGYTIEQQKLDNESFALTVLSQDSNYDMCIINSEQDYSGNIRNKGSFYPLNDIEGVSEYLDKCFPYVKEAAYTSDGEIWMLPVLLNAGAIYYSPENCRSAGIELSEDMRFSSFIEQCKTASRSEFSSGYSVHCYQLTQNMLFDYISGHDSFDTEVFREFAEYAKENANISAFPEYMPITNPAENNIIFGTGADSFLFGYIRDGDWQKNYADNESFRACPAPKLEPGTKNTVTCAFITVNPSSSNLGAALDYIGTLAKHLSQQENSLILADRSLYSETDYMSDLYKIYENGRICFNVSSEIIFDDYIRYCSGDTDLDSLITEADRKLTAYLNE